MCLSIIENFHSLFRTTKTPSFVLTKPRPDMESVPCSNSGEEKPFLSMIEKLGWKGPVGFI